jgi:hypothetical protein
MYITSPLTQPRAELLVNLWASRIATLATCLFLSCLTADALVIPPADPMSSCASAEYAALKTAQHQPPDASESLVVVSGRPPLNTTVELHMGRQVTVCAMGLHNWIYEQKKNPGNLRLFIGGYLLSTIVPTAISPAGQEYVNFTLQMDTADSDDWKAWAAIIDTSRHSANAQLPLNLALVDTKEVFPSSAVVTIIAYPRNWPYILLGFVVLLAALIWLAATTDLLRYTVGDPPSAPQKSPYSLGLTQMAVWFYLVVAAYVYICISTHQVHIAMGSVLGLLGISSTTGLAAVFVDKQKETTSRSQRTVLVTERIALNTRISELLSTPITPGSSSEAELMQKKSRAAEVDAALTQLTPSPSGISKNFFADILNDGEGISFHRFQIFIWTIVLGSVFVWSVYRNMSMPEFDASLLTLMGISAGTYVGFKFPEKQK